MMKIGDKQQSDAERREESASYCALLLRLWVEYLCTAQAGIECNYRSANLQTRNQQTPDHTYG